MIHPCKIMPGNECACKPSDEVQKEVCAESGWFTVDPLLDAWVPHVHEQLKVIVRKKNRLSYHVTSHTNDLDD